MQLFVDFAGKPLQFTITKGEHKREIRRKIEEYGGVIVASRLNAFACICPNDYKSLSPDLIIAQYIDDCIAQKRIIPSKEKYRVANRNMNSTNTYKHPQSQSRTVTPVISPLLQAKELKAPKYEKIVNNDQEEVISDHVTMECSGAIKPLTPTLTEIYELDVHAEKLLEMFIMQIIPGSNNQGLSLDLVMEKGQEHLDVLQNSGYFWGALLKPKLIPQPIFQRLLLCSLLILSDSQFLGSADKTQNAHQACKIIEENLFISEGNIEAFLDVVVELRTLTAITTNNSDMLKLLIKANLPDSRQALLEVFNKTAFSNLVKKRYDDIFEDIADGVDLTEKYFTIALMVRFF